MGTTWEPLAKKFSLHGVFCWAEKGCSEQLAVLLHAAHLQGTSGAWRVTPVFSWGMSCQSSSGAVQLWVCQLPNGAAVTMCLLAELLETQKPQRRLQCANVGTSHTFWEVSGGRLTPQLSGPRQEPKPRVLTFTWELLHLQSKLNTLLQSMTGVSLVGFVFRRDELLSKYWFLFPSLSTAQYIARISISCCLCELKWEKENVRTGLHTSQHPVSKWSPFLL